MRGITRLLFVFKRTARDRFAAAVAACALAAGCSSAQPTPTMPALSSALPATSAGAPVPSVQGGTGQGWQDFAARGWNCRTPNSGPVTVCSPPNQPLPVVALPPAQPPADRPETVMLKRWRNGVFDANVLLIRPEIYNGQLCESTNQAYIYVSVLGYFECAHPGGN